MPESILVTGATGQLGRSLQKIANDYSQYKFTFVDRKTIDLLLSKSISEYFENNKFDFIINAAAYTAVDKAESEPELADKINHLAVKQLAEIAKQKNISLIHISTDYVFNGKNYKPYKNNDETDPQNVYGLTKLKGEQALQKINPRGCIIRTSWVYSEFGNNFVKTMLRLGQEQDELNVISDQVGTPTYATDLAYFIMSVLQESKESIWIANKIFHFSNEGVCSWYDLATATIEEGVSLGLLEATCHIKPIRTDQYPVVAVRPYYSVFEKSLEFPSDNGHWVVSLRKMLNELT